MGESFLISSVHSEEEAEDLLKMITSKVTI